MDGVFAQGHADTLCFQVATLVCVPGWIIVRVGGLGGAMDKAGSCACQFIFQSATDPVPDVGVVRTGKGGNGGAMNGVQAKRTGRNKAVTLLLVDA